MKRAAVLPLGGRGVREERHYKNVIALYEAGPTNDETVRP
jgi:hypothetical protein